MVAESPALPAKPAKTKRQIVSAAWPIKDRLTVKAMYEVHERTPAQIAAFLKRPASQVSDLIWRQGWSQKKAERTRELTVKTDARAREQLGKVVEAVATLAEQGSVNGLQRAVDASTKKGKFAARDYRSWAGGARDLVNVARQARGLDSQQGGTGAVTTFNLTQLVVRGEPVPRLAEQVIEVKAEPVPVAQVQPNTAKP